MLVAWLPKSTDTAIASVRFRCLTPLKTLQDADYPVEIYDATRDSEYSVLVISKRYDEQALKLAKHFRSQNKAVILDLSDNHFYNPKQLPAYVKVAEDLQAMLRHVDLVTVCSAYLGHIVRQNTRDDFPIAVVEDAVEDLDVIRVSDRKRPTDPLKLLWFGSHGSPNADAGIRDIARLSQYFSGVDLPSGSYLTVLSNNRKSFDEHRDDFGLPARYAEWKHDKFCDLLSSTDAVVIPIGQTPFSKSKSNNRLATALWYEIPVLADTIPAYKPFAEYAFLDEWQQGIQDVINCRPQLSLKTAAGSEFARRKCTNEAIAGQWRRAFETAHKLRSDQSAKQRSVDSPISKLKQGVQAIVAKSKTVRQPGYPSDAISIIEKLPLRSRVIGQPFDRLLARLNIERGQYDSSKLPDDLKIGIIADCSANTKADLLLLLDSLKAQSFPNIKVIIHVDDSTLATKARQWATDHPLEDITIAETEADVRNSMAATDFCVFTDLGDTLDPSACGMISLYADTADIVSFGAVHHAEKKCDRNIVPYAVDGPTLDHAPLLGNAFAVRSSLALAYSGDLLRELRVNRLHLFQLWVRRTRACRLICHPELLMFKQSNREIPDRWFSDYQSAYQALFNLAADHRMNLHTNGADVPYNIQPIRKALGVSVLIAFRDRPEMTLEAINSLVESKRDVDLQVILIDNQSRPETLAELQSELAQLEDLQVTWVSYPHSFNHSAQMNVGAQHAIHPILLFMNNDCMITSDHVVDELAAWAMQPGIGTVGVKIGNPKSGLASAGISVRDILSNRYDSPVQDDVSHLTMPYTRRVFGNSFAFCAIERQRYIDLGGLDEAKFPVGYNDVDFAARLNKSGLTSICLGHHTIQHPPGQSRSKTDETGQKIVLRTMYGDVFALFRDDFYEDPNLIGRPVFEAKS
ncbi:MAG: glycosyltransferase [Pseudomonadota bacterium]